ncbi:hypothetical protein ACQR1Y_16900 [Bradyrhizobium sp. HKCCYLRH3099]|uniref:hypothetical protein n=1 Tax=unclassified Bradyrhizobium TaxID=2631580 RepID=UPI003EBAC9A3
MNGLRRMASGLAIMGAACLGGCAAPLAVNNVTDIRSTTGSRGIDVYETKRRTDPSAPDFAGDQLVEVRTFHNPEQSGEVEMAGASCSLEASGFTATMTSPAKVRVPLYRGQSSTLAVTCQKPGYQKRMITVAPYDATRQARLASGANGGILGAVIVAGIDAAADNTKNDWRYPVAKVVLEADAPSGR